MIDSMNIPSPNSPPSNQLPRRSLLPLALLAMLLVVLLLLGQWFWLTRTLNPPEAPILLPSERAPLFSALFRQPAIVGSLLLSAVTMGLAVMAAVSPLTWWVQVAGLFRTAPGLTRRRVQPGQELQSAEEWVAAQAVALGVPPAAIGATDPIGVPPSGVSPTVAPTAQPQSQPGVAPGAGSQPTLPSQPGAVQTGQPSPQPGAPSVPGQQPVLPQPLPVQQPGAPPAPGALPPPNLQQPAAQPGAPQPQGQPAPAAQPPTPSLQQMLAPAENVDIKELTDIGDILSSFKDEDEIPAQLLALSQSLDEVVLEKLVAHTHRVATELATLNARP